MADEEIRNHNGLAYSPNSVVAEDGCGDIKVESSDLNGLTPIANTKYVQLLNVIEELSRDLRPTYAGSKTSTERIKKGIVHARILVRECLIETERSAQHQ